ncbi:hypothetical protein HCN44_005952 [Aphidius gifuensis]|uniref:Uncharacterized protein n=1 Tax=Aphidius gifuensis TaxID=684658 RepID=A0A834XZV5_APHGI|nr:hypothetical protein HCN44_005952 [Aphidius gifuensis]
MNNLKKIKIVRIQDIKRIPSSFGLLDSSQVVSQVSSQLPDKVQQSHHQCQVKNNDNYKSSTKSPIRKGKITKYTARVSPFASTCKKSSNQYTINNKILSKIEKVISNCPDGNSVVTIDPQEELKYIHLNHHGRPINKLFLNGVKRTTDKNHPVQDDMSTKIHLETLKKHGQQFGVKADSKEEEKVDQPTPRRKVIYFNPRGRPAKKPRVDVGDISDDIRESTECIGQNKFHQQRKNHKLHTPESSLCAATDLSNFHQLVNDKQKTGPSDETTNVTWFSMHDNNDLQYDDCIDEISHELIQDNGTNLQQFEDLKDIQIDTNKITDVNYFLDEIRDKFSVHGPNDCEGVISPSQSHIFEPANTDIEKTTPVTDCSQLSSSSVSTASVKVSNRQNSNYSDEVNLQINPRKINIMTSELAGALDRTNTTSRSASFILAAA